MIIILLSCKKEDPVLPDGAERLVGEWRWIGSSGGFSGGHILPEQEDDRKLKFDPDGIYACLCDPYTTGTYGIGEPEWAPYEHRIFYTRVPHTYRMGDVQDARFLSADTLVLSDVCRDCYMHTYVRVQ